MPVEVLAAPRSITSSIARHRTERVAAQETFVQNAVYFREFGQKSVHHTLKLGGTPVAPHGGMGQRIAVDETQGNLGKLERNAAQRVDSSSDRASREGLSPSEEPSEPWVWLGVIAGLVGAAVVAIFFFAIDLSAGQPFRTPGALGSALFLGERLPSGIAPNAGVVAGYSLLHGTIFVAVSLLASIALFGRRHRLGPASGLALAAALFAVIECLFVILVGFGAPYLLSEFGIGMIATANLLAALAMAAVIVQTPSARPVRRTSDDRS